jgi:hypothetical protein
VLAAIGALAAGWLAGVASPAAAGTVPVGYTPAQLQAAYQLPASAGVGRLVAVVAPDDDPNVGGDLAAYRSYFGEAACPQTQSWATQTCLTVVNESGELIFPGSGTAPGANSVWSLKTSAQLDAISAACPGCRLLLVEVNSAAISEVGTGVETAVKLGAQVITTGVQDPESSSDPTYDSNYFKQPGVEITAAAGDSGYPTSATQGVEYPAASQYVTAVGGTTLTRMSSAAGSTCTPAVAGSRGWCETAWNDSYGATVSGCSADDSAPSWQTSGVPAAVNACDGKRPVADVAADADPATGIAVYDSYGTISGSNGSGWQSGPDNAGIGSTAVAAAIVAGAYALAGLPNSNADPASNVYGNPSDPAATALHQRLFNDITAGNDIPTGSNTTCSPAYLCAAGAGYDGPTGLGSPDGVTGFLSSYYYPASPSIAGSGIAGNGVAFQSNTGDLYLYYPGNIGNTDSNLGMAPGTNASTAVSPSGSYEVAFQANTGHLFIYYPDSNGNTDSNLGMAPGTSPAIVWDGSEFVVAFQANTGHLFLYYPGNNSNVDKNLGMEVGTSPSIASNGSGYEVAFQANTNTLYDTGNGGDGNSNVVMAPGTSPSIASDGSSYEAAFQATNGHLFTYDPGSKSSVDKNLGMEPGTSPSIASNGSGYEAAIEANTGTLHFNGNGGDSNCNLGMAAGSSPSIAFDGSSYEVAVQANTGHLYTCDVRNNSGGDANLGMWPPEL